MGKILLQNVILDGQISDLLVTDGIIAKIAPSGSLCCSGEDVEKYDSEGRTAHPGFVNMHTHAGMALMRGVGEDIGFHEWLARIWEIEKNIDEVVEILEKAQDDDGYLNTFFQINNPEGKWTYIHTHESMCGPYFYKLK